MKRGFLAVCTLAILGWSPWAAWAREPLQYYTRASLLTGKTDTQDEVVVAQTDLAANDADGTDPVLMRLAAAAAASFSRSSGTQWEPAAPTGELTKLELTPAPSPTPERAPEPSRPTIPEASAVTSSATKAPTPADPNVTLVTNGWVDVRIILQEVVQSAGYGLQIAPDVAGEVNVHLQGVSLDVALRSILEPNHLGYEIIDGNVLVYKDGKLTRWFSFDYPVTERQGRGELLVSGRGGSAGGGSSGDENESHVTSSSTMRVWPQVMGALQTIVFESVGNPSSGGGEDAGQGIHLSDEHGRTLVINPMAGLIQVTAEWSRVHRVEGFLSRLEESLLRQVAIEVKIMEVTFSDTDRSGIDWTALVDGNDVIADLATTESLGNPAFSLIVEGGDVSGVMEMISEQGTIKVLSTPRITTLNNQKAVVRVVVEEVFFAAQVAPPVVTNGVVTEATVEYAPQFIPVGIVLDVTPQIGQGGVVTLNVHPTITDIVRIESSPNQDTQPVLSVRELDTVGTVNDGQTLVIAGLMSEGFKKAEKGIPVLKDIPLLGYLFKRSVTEKTQTELVMLLSPVILDRDQAQIEGAVVEKAFGQKMWTSEKN